MSAYEIITLIITGAGALATFLAVVVALWQTKYAIRKKLKCEFLYAYVPVNQATIEIKQYVSVSISNIGNKKVIINNWGIKIKDGFIQILTSGSEHDIFDEIDSVKTPYTLEPEEEVSFFYDGNLFKEVIKNQIEHGKIKAENKLKFVVHDSTGKSYYIKSKDKASAYIK